jgi:ubiquinone/menaquinone biosynthesis C-methylase UbiE
MSVGPLYDAVLAPLGWLGVTAARAELLADLHGSRGQRVLEVGAGTGLNLAHYPHPPQVVSDRDLRALVGSRRVPAGTEVVEADVEALPFPPESFDVVVGTLVFCSVRRPEVGLAEIRRVLRPGGELRLLEHVRAPGPLGVVLDGLDPLWHALEGACHLNRRTVDAVQAAGFRVERREVRWAGVLELLVARRP